MWKVESPCSRESHTQRDLGVIKHSFSPPDSEDMDDSCPMQIIELVQINQTVTKHTHSKDLCWEGPSAYHSCRHSSIPEDRGNRIRNFDAVWNEVWPAKRNAG